MPKTAAAKTPPRTDPAAAQAEKLIGDAVGKLMEFWGFRKNLGRIWTLLYLEPEPLSAPEIGKRLKLATGTVSMSLGELITWGAIQKVYREGERRDFYQAETDLWRLITGVLRVRERKLLGETQQAVERAREALEASASLKKDPLQAFKHQRILLLSQLTQMVLALFDQLLDQKKIDVTPFMSVFFGKKK